MKGDLCIYCVGIFGSKNIIDMDKKQRGGARGRLGPSDIDRPAPQYIYVYLRGYDKFNLFGD